MTLRNRFSERKQSKWRASSAGRGFTLVSYPSALAGLLVVIVCSQTAVFCFLLCRLTRGHSQFPASRTEFEPCGGATVTPVVHFHTTATSATRLPTTAFVNGCFKWRVGTNELS